MRQKTRRIVVAGAGPAGLACALELSRQGHEVSVLEQKRNLDAQGSGVLLQPTGLAILERLGLREEVENKGQLIRRISGSTGPSNRRVVSVHYDAIRKGGYALGIDRLALWQTLYEQVTRRGIEIRTGVNVSAIEHVGRDHVRVVTQDDGNDDTFDLVVDASGAHSALHAWCVRPVRSRTLDYGSLWSKVALPEGSEFDSDEMVLMMDSRNQGIGLLPSGQGSVDGKKLLTLFFNLQWRDCPSWEDGGFERWKHSAQNQWPKAADLIAQLISPEQLYLAKFQQHTLSHPYGDRIVFIGDAAHASNPQLGQGINMSLIDALSVAWALGKESDTDRALARYASARRVHVSIYQSLARFLTPFYQSDARDAIVLRDALYPLFSSLWMMKSITAYILSGHLGGPLRHLKR